MLHKSSRFATYFFKQKIDSCEILELLKDLLETLFITNCSSHNHEKTKSFR